MSGKFSKYKTKPDRRARATGRLGVERGERFALMPVEVMCSATYAAQPDFAKAVLFAVTAQFYGPNNGNLSLTFKSAREHGILQQWKLFAGLHLLKRGDLIQTTRQGKLEGGSKLCSLYAVTWRGIDQAPEGVTYDYGISAGLPTNAWVTWERPADWEMTVRSAKRATQGKSKIPVSNTGVADRSITGVAERSKTAQSRVVLETPISAQPVCVSSKTLALRPATSARMNGAHGPKSRSNAAPKVRAAQKPASRAPATEETT